MTAPRVGSDAPFRRMDFVKTMVGSMKQAEHYIAWNDALRDIASFLGSRDLKSAMLQRSEEATHDLQEWLQLLGIGKVRATATFMDRASEFFRTNIVVSTIGFNVASVMKAPVSFLTGARRLDNPVTALESLMRFASHPKKTWDFVKSKSVMMRNRPQNAERELAEFAEKSDFKSWITGKPAAIQQARDAAMSMWRVADMATTISLWDAKYREVLTATLNPEQARLAADELIETTQPVGGLLYMPPIRRGSGLARGFTMFTGQLNQNAQLGWEIGANYRGVLSSSLDVLVFFILSGTIIHMLSNGFRLPKDKREWLQAWLGQFTDGIPLMREATRAALAMIFDATKEDFYRIDFTPTTLAPLESALKAVSRRDWDRAMESGLQVSGAPGVIQARRVYRGMEEFMDTKDPRYLIWSEYTLDGDQTKSASRAGARGGPRGGSTGRGESRGGKRGE